MQREREGVGGDHGEMQDGGHATHRIASLRSLEKAPTGIRGLDEITSGGLPRGRPTLVCGGPGCGKTLFSIEFVVRGAIEHGEPGAIISFEETAEELTRNVASLGFDLDDLVRRGLLVVDYVRVERDEIEETGEYDLEGLFIRLGYALDSVGAKRIAMDTLEALFSALRDESVLRAELRRLFRWLKERGVTAVITAERGEGALTRQGLEEYVSDCVILLEQRLHERVATRHLRVVKYRGTSHGTSEYPFLIHERGISVLPVTSLGLAHATTNERISSGIPQLDAMLGGKGFYRGSSVLVSGTAGTGKTSIAAHAIAAACRRGERSLFFAFEESQGQIVRNMRTIGVDLQPGIDQGLIRFKATRPTMFGLEMHLVTMHSEIDAFKPSLVVIDPLTNLMNVGSDFEVTAMLTRLVDYLKSNNTTAIFNSLTSGGSTLEQTTVGVSSLMDTWLLLRFFETNGERNRGLYVLKSRGMAHSNQVREFVISEHGIDLVDVYVGASGVLTGTARYEQESKSRAVRAAQEQEIERKQREIERKRAVIEAQIIALRAQQEAEEQDLHTMIAETHLRDRTHQQERDVMVRMRQADSTSGTPRRDAPDGGAA